jgi:hypothetical protein
MPIRQVPIAGQVSPELMTAFKRTVSPERLRTYRMASGFRDDVAIKLYLWNAAVGQSFHFPLQTVEVALRNVCHDALCDQYGENWCFNDACRAALGLKAVVELTKAETRYNNIYGRVPTTPQLLASLSLGFWVSLLRRNYVPLIWTRHSQEAFPNLSAGETMNDVSRVGTKIQDWRNRIFHQEPLIGQDLSGNYSNILKMLGWICIDTREWTREHSCVPKVIRERPR